MASVFRSRSRVSTSWLFNPPLSGAWAVVVSVAAVAIPTMVALVMTPGVDDRTCTIFCPFVLITAILCDWRYASPVALGSALACNTILMGAPYTFHFQRAEFEGLGVFLGYSAFVIIIVRLFRATAARSLRQAGAEGSGIVFSLEQGQVWASWYGVDAPVRLGPRDHVAGMMQDFLAQVELGRRFENRANAGQLRDRHAVGKSGHS